MVELPKKEKTSDEDKREGDESSAVATDIDTEDAQIRVNKQCFLLRNMEPLMKARASESPSTFQHFACVTDQPMDVTNELVSIKGLGAMFKLTSAQHAALVPRIRLFLTKDGKPIEVPFDASLSTGSGKHTIADMVRSSNFRGSGVGIKGFSYELAGTDTHTADKLITAKLSIHCKTIADLFAARLSTEGETFQYADLINLRKASLKPKKKSTENKYIDDDSYRYELKAVVGWADVPSGHPLFPSAPLRRAISQAKTTFSLQLINHAISYKQNGTLDLDIDYMASIEYALSTNGLDVFWMPESLEAEEVVSGIQRERDILADGQLKQTAYSIIDKDLREGRITPETAATMKQEIRGRYSNQKKDRVELIERQIERVEQIRRIRKTFAYRRITNFLIGGENSESGKLREIRVDPDELGIVGANGKQRVLSTKAAAATNDSKANEKIVDGAKKASQKAQNTAARRMEGTLQSSAKGKLTTAKIKDNKSRHVAGAKAPSDRQEEDGKVQILYFYLGDLVDILLKILKEPSIIDGKSEENKEAQETLERVRIILGPAVMVKQNASGLVSRGGNLADLPISFDLFENWFINNVIRPQKRKYFFKDFITDLMRDLIGPVLGSGCYAGERQKGKVATIPLRVPKLSNGTARIPNRSRCNLSQIKKRKQTVLEPEIGSTSIREANDYLYFYMPDTRLKDRFVDEAKDLRDGIYHLRVGQDRGMVISVEFNKSAIKFHKEMNITNDALTAEGFLREKYNAKIKMVGNSFFIPGQYVYITPTVPGYEPGRGTNNHVTTGMLQSLGFGGYYLVNKVDHMITSDYYQTEIEAIWEAYGSNKRGVRGYENMYNIGDCKIGALVASEPFNFSSRQAELIAQARDETLRETVLGTAFGMAMGAAKYTSGLAAVATALDSAGLAEEAAAIESLGDNVVDGAAQLGGQIEKYLNGDGEGGQ